MANVADYAIILDGDANITVDNVFTRTFFTPRVLRGTAERAILLLTARGLRGDVSVLVNDQNVGQIRGAGSNDEALARTILFRSDVLNGAQNTIEITATEVSGNFGLTDMVCLYRQSTGD